MNRILIIQTASLGDVILSTALIEKLHDYYPIAKIDFLLKKGYEALFEGHPILNNVYSWEKKANKYSNLTKLLLKIRREQYDLVINVQRFASSGLITALSGATLKTGFKKNPFSVFFSKSHSHQIGKEFGGLHEIYRNQKLIEPFTNQQVFKPKLYPRQQDFEKINSFVLGNYITISPASLWFTKQFPEKKWIGFLNEIGTELRVIFLGSPNEFELCERIIQTSSHKNCLNLAGKLTFLESAALMEKARINYVNDSAPMHLASSVNAPVAAIFCSTVPEYGFGPLSEKSFIIQTKKNLTCRPCGLHGWQKCPKQHFDCAFSIENNQLLDIL